RGASVSVRVPASGCKWARRAAAFFEAGDTESRPNCWHGSRKAARADPEAGSLAEGGSEHRTTPRPAPRRTRLRTRAQAAAKKPEGSGWVRDATSSGNAGVIGTRALGGR